ncbi:MAG: Rho termination factor N-terminal domain-containing protein [Candidatus Eisenbacteria bacterium]|uniref:Rho termination factor N-terminal domain-containing protein n=1 Tax=Eiseniibacteriota bacterium TaxID=2212470 RepID=A0A937X8E6_UNCEI|nr:Rho termination factor N-terminal domain-containing protein [Candidatus Eisenbacteria bacterium]
MDFHELSKQTVVKLREMAQQYEDVVGASGMRKEELIDLLCQRMGIEKPKTVVVGIPKGEIKAQIRKLRKARDEALAGKDLVQVRAARHKIHLLRRKLRRSLRVTGK